MKKKKLQNQKKNNIIQRIRNRLKKIVEKTKSNDLCFD